MKRVLFEFQTRYRVQFRRLLTMVSDIELDNTETKLACVDQVKCKDKLFALSTG